MEEIIVMVGYKPKEGMWEKYAEVCHFITVSTIKETKDVFAEFKPFN